MTTPHGGDRDLDRKVSSSMAFGLLGTIVSKLLKVGALFFVLERISRADLGLAQTSTTVYTILQSLTELGLGAALVQSRDTSEELLEGTFWLSVVASIGLFVLTLGGAFGVAAFYDEPLLAPLVQVQALGVLLFALYAVPKSLLVKELGFGRITLADNLAGAVSAVAMIVLVARGHGVWAIVTGEVIGRFVELLLYQAFRPWFPKRFRWDLATVRPLLDFGVYNTGARFLYRFYTEADYLVIGKVFGPSATGLYAFAFRTVDDITKTLVSSISQVAYPAFAQLQADHARLASFLYGIARGAMVLTGSVLVLVFVLAHDLLDVLGYEQWHEAVPLVRIFCLVGVLRTVLPLLPQLLNALGRARFVFNYTVLLSFVLPIGFYGASRFGVEAVAWSWVVVYPPVAFALVVASARALDVPVLTATRRIFAMLPVVLALGAAGYGFRELLDRAGLPPLLRIVLVMAMVVSSAALWVYEREPAFVARVLRRKSDRTVGAEED